MELHTLQTSSESFEDIFVNEADSLITLATYMVSSKSLAEDIVQEAFLKLHKSWFSVSNPGGYLRVAVLNLCKDVIKKRSVRRKHLHLIVGKRQHEDSDLYLVDALQKLEYKKRVVIVLKFHGGLTLQEIADTTEMPIGTVRSYYYRGLNELKEVMTNE